MPHVIKIQGNSQGCDYIISDPHGSCLAEFQQFYQGLQPGDRVFIAGDIGDRGQQSQQWYDYITSIQAISGALPISCIRGNHEDLIARTSRCLSSFEALAQGADSIAF